MKRQSRKGQGTRRPRQALHGTFRWLLHPGLCLAIGILAILTGCGGGTAAPPAGRSGTQPTGVSEVLAAGIAAAEAESRVAAENRTAEANVPAANRIAEANVPAANGTDAESMSAPGAPARQSGLNEGAPLPEVYSASMAASGREVNTENVDPAGAASGEIDVDLTALSSTMVYAEVCNMMVDPEPYVGKTVKMAGLFSSFHDEANDKYYFACIVMDATQCCAQGIEFVPEEDLRFPEDFPKEEDEITVTGVFDTYEEGGYKFCTLRNAKFL